MASIFHSSDVTVVTSGVTNAIKDNFLPVLGMFAFIVGLSIVMALIDMHTQSKWMENEAKRWRS